MNELIVVTGASTGMGAATAKELARKGFHVLAGVRREADADKLRGRRYRTAHPRHHRRIGHRRDRRTGRRRSRPLRALINNAGIAINAPVETLPLADWRQQFEVNLFGHIAMTQALLPALLSSSGTVVNISSVGGKVVLPTYGAYAGSKFALEAVSDALRREVSKVWHQGGRHRTRRGQDRDGRAGAGHRGSFERRDDGQPTGPV